MTASDTELYRLCGCAVTAMLCLLVLKQADGGSGISRAAEGFLSLLFTGAALSAVLPVLARLRVLCAPYLSEETFSVLWRAAAAGLTVELTGDLLRGAGEEGLAGRLLFCGRGFLLLIGFPLIEELFSAAYTLMRGTGF